MTKIDDVFAREILDSRGFPTIESEVRLDDGTLGKGASPAGASVGSHEAIELRDNDPSRRMGLGVLKAVENVNTVIKDSIVGMEAEEQEKIDTAMITVDGTDNKSRLGANSILSVSIAVANAVAKSKSAPLFIYLKDLAKPYGVQAETPKLPTPIFNLINGGKHGYGSLDFQEFQIIPSPQKSYSDALSLGIEVYQSLGRLLKDRKIVHSVGDEGAYAPNIFTNKEAFKTIAEAVSRTSYKIKVDYSYGLDVASNTFFKNDVYSIKDHSEPLTTTGLIEYFEKLNEEYPLGYLEDAISEDDWEGWQELNQKFSGKMTVFGDDLIATNPERLSKAVEIKACGGVLIKPNQIGTLSETFKVIKIAKDANMKVAISHRLGETTDAFIADLAVAVAADYVKFGAPVRGERVVKYNRLLQIESKIQ